MKRDSQRVLSFEISGWPGLGMKAKLQLGSRRTVLVGLNGAGKSLLMGGIVAGAQVAIGFRALATPAKFKCELGTGMVAELTYEYERSIEADPTNVERTSGRFEVAHVVSERCIRNGKDVWRIADGELQIGKASGAFPRGIGLLSVGLEVQKLPAEARILRSIFRRTRLIPAGVPREGHNRADVILSRPQRNGRRLRRYRSHTPGRIARLAERIAELWQFDDDELFAEFSALVRKLGLADTVDVVPYSPVKLETPEEDKVDGDTEDDPTHDIALVLLDGVNIGRMSDGTLRVLEVLIALVAEPGMVLFVEEPETSIHPGLLARLLAVVESYEADRQVIFSTHSPQVVNWCDPADLRFVERRRSGTRGRTLVRTLGNKETSRINAYLAGDGFLDEYIFFREDD